LSYPLRPAEYGKLVETSLADAIERSECEHAAETLRWWSFEQVFANTSFMGGGIGGQMITSGQMVAVLLDDGMFVYCGGRFAYKSERREGVECVKREHFPPSRGPGRPEPVPADEVKGILKPARSQDERAEA
jgi:hypothetical protein